MAEQRPPPPQRATIAPKQQWAAARSRLIEIIARQLVAETLQERHESLPVRPLQH